MLSMMTVLFSTILKYLFIDHQKKKKLGSYIVVDYRYDRKSNQSGPPVVMCIPIVNIVVLFLDVIFCLHYICILLLLKGKDPDLIYLYNRYRQIKNCLCRYRFCLLTGFSVVLLNFHFSFYLELFRCIFSRVATKSNSAYNMMNVVRRPGVNFFVSAQYLKNEISDLNETWYTHA